MEHRFKIIGIGFIIVALTSTIYAGHPGVGAYQNQAYEQAKEQFKASLLDDPDNGKITYNLEMHILSWETMIVRLKPMKRP